MGVAYFAGADEGGIGGIYCGRNGGGRHAVGREEHKAVGKGYGGLDGWRWWEGGGRRCGTWLDI